MNQSPSIHQKVTVNRKKCASCFPFYITLIGDNFIIDRVNHICIIFPIALNEAIAVHPTKQRKLQRFCFGNAANESNKTNEQKQLTPIHICIHTYKSWKLMW